MTEIDFSKMKSELIKIYDFFSKNPQDKKISYLITKYDSIYGGLTAYNETLTKSPVPKEIEQALNGLSTIYQYGLWEDTHEAFSNDKIVKEARKILEKLKKENKK